MITVIPFGPPAPQKLLPLDVGASFVEDAHIVQKLALQPHSSTESLYYFQNLQPWTPLAPIVMDISTVSDGIGRMASAPSQPCMLDSYMTSR